MTKNKPANDREKVDERLKRSLSVRLSPDDAHQMRLNLGKVVEKRRGRMSPQMFIRQTVEAAYGETHAPKLKNRKRWILLPSERELDAAGIPATSGADFRTLALATGQSELESLLSLVRGTSLEPDWSRDGEDAEDVTMLLQRSFDAIVESLDLKRYAKRRLQVPESERPRWPIVPIGRACFDTPVVRIDFEPSKTPEEWRNADGFDEDSNPEWLHSLFPQHPLFQPDGESVFMGSTFIEYRNFTIVYDHFKDDQRRAEYDRWDTITESASARHRISFVRGYTENRFGILIYSDKKTGELEFGFYLVDVESLSDYGADVGQEVESIGHIKGQHLFRLSAENSVICDLDHGGVNSFSPHANLIYPDDHYSLDDEFGRMILNYNNKPPKWLEPVGLNKMFETREQCFKPAFEIGETDNLSREGPTVGQALLRHLQTMPPDKTIMADLARRLQTDVEDFDGKWDREFAKTKAAEEDLIAYLKDE